MRTLALEQRRLREPIDKPTLALEQRRLKEPIDKPTFIFALAAFGGVSLYGITVAGLILVDMVSKIW